MSDSLRALLDSTPLGAGNAPYVESLYEQYLADPASVEPKWRDYFRALVDGSTRETAHGPIREQLAKRARDIRVSTTAPAAASLPADASAKQGAVSRLVQVYANRGHLIARLDPLGLTKRPVPKVLELEYFGLSAADLDQEFFTGSRTGAIAPFMKLADIIEKRRKS